MDRYLIQPSTELQEWWTVTDLKYGLVCRFEKNYYNETQKFTLLDPQAVVGMSPTEIARLPRLMSDWLIKNHPDLVTPNSNFPQCEIDRIGTQLKSLRKEQDMSIEEVAFKANEDIDTIKSIESGEYAVDLDLLAVIVKILGAEINITRKLK